MWRPADFNVLADYYYTVYDNNDEREICETLLYDNDGYYLATDRVNIEGELLDLSREDVVNWARNCGGELGLLLYSALALHYLCPRKEKHVIK